MFSYNCNVLISIVFNYLELTQSLVEMPLIEENEIVKSEGIIRNTFNRLFHNLKLKKIEENTKLEEYSTIHKFFTSLTLQDFDTLNQIARIVRVNNKNVNKTTNFMAIINNVFALNQFVENSKNKPNDDYENVITYILYFMKNLKKLKQTNSVDKVYLNISTNILKLLKEHRTKSNDSFNFYNSVDNNNPNDNEFWGNNLCLTYLSDICNMVLDCPTEPSGRRIFKGDRTKIKHFPFMASIQIFSNFHCAGSIVKSDLIITASSCLQLAWNNRLFRENPAFLSARVGSSFYGGGGEVIPVLEVYFHPDYNPKNLRNNICMLRLSRHLNFRKKSRRIKRIDFDRQPSSIPVTTPGITILGWGAKEHSSVIGNPWKNVLSFTVLHLYPLEDCRDVYSREYVTRKNFCAGFFSRGGGACNRDVGGPGIADGKLVGVISFGSPVCGTPDAPTVFTKLGYYSDWIEEIMDMDVPVFKKKTTVQPLHDSFTAPPLYMTPKSTTFRIPPLTGEKMTPIPITEIDNHLRIFDENSFKDFLDTVFHSEEVAANEDVEDDEQSVQLETTIKFGNNGTKYYEEVTEKSKRDPEYEDISTEESGAKDKDTALTIMNTENDEDEDNIEKLIENVNLEKIVKEEVMVTPMVVKDISEGRYIKFKGAHKSKNESLLTLLYLSDDEKKGNVKINPEDDKLINDERSEISGMSIPVDFEDMTRAKDKVLPESDLFRLLSEVIGQEIPEIDINS